MTQQAQIANSLSFVLGAILLLSSCAPARFGALPPPDLGSKADPDRYAAHRKYLSDSNLEGRLPGSKGFDLAARYLVQQFSAMGLEPAGEDGSYFSRVEVTAAVRWGPHTDLGFASGDPESVESGPGKGVVFTAQGMDYAVAPFSSEGEFQGGVLFGGYCTQAAGQDDFSKWDLKGQVLLCLRDGPFTPAFRASDQYKVFRARSRGAAAVFFIAGRSERELPAFAPSPQAEEAGLPVYYVTADLAARVFQLSGEGAKFAAIQQQASRRGRPRPLRLDGVRAGGAVELIRERQQLPNVVGWIHPSRGPAGGPAGEIVVAGASLGGGDGDGSGAPGAPAGLLELARVLQGERASLRRSVLIAALLDSPSGGLGAKALFDIPLLHDAACLVNLVESGPEKQAAVRFSGARTGEGIAQAIAHLGKEARLAASDSFFGPEAAFWSRKIPALRAALVGSKALDPAARLVAALASDPGVPRFAEPEDFLLGPPGAAVSSRGILVDPSPAPGGGARVAAVLEGLAAGAAGLRAGDTLVRVGGDDVRSARELFFAFSDLAPDQEAEVFYRRGSRVQSTRLSRAAP